MSVECFSTKDGRFNHKTCLVTQACCGGECCDKEYDFYIHWYFWVAVTVLTLLILAAILSGFCHNCRDSLPCNILNSRCGLGRHSRLGYCAWVWSLDEDKGPCNFLGYQAKNSKGQQYTCTSISHQETANLSSTKSPEDPAHIQEDSKELCT